MHQNLHLSSTIWNFESLKKAFRWLGRVAFLLAALLLVTPFLELEARETVAGQVPVVRIAELPEEARVTLDLIRRGGPYPHARDGIVFGNRERLLPAAPRGSYREYTVKTPWRRDRGARRIVASAGGEFYYTADHYRSFRRIVE